MANRTVLMAGTNQFIVIETSACWTTPISVHINVKISKLGISVDVAMVTSSTEIISLVMVNGDFKDFLFFYA